METGTPLTHMQTHTHLYPHIRRRSFTRSAISVLQFAELESPIIENEDLKSINQLRSDQSPEQNLLINKLFIYSQNVSVKYRTTLFNKIFDSGYFPTCWSIGVIVPTVKELKYTRLKCIEVLPCYQ